MSDHDHDVHDHDAHKHAADEILTITLRDAEPGKWVADVWLREAKTTVELAEILRTIADDFDNGEAKRVG